MLVYLVRHGQSYNTHPEPDYPTINPPLTPTGQAQVELLAERLGKMRVDRLLSSPMVRAVETSRAIAATTGRTVEVWFRCHEHRETPGYVCWGARGLAAHFPDLVLLPDFGPDDWFYGSEPLKSAVARADALLKMLAESWRRSPGQRVVVSTHGAILRTVIGRIIRADPRLMDRCWVHNASLTTLEYTGLEWRVIGVNDTGHLAGHPELDSALGITRW
jgi:broad specificity phosphatase PhoE